ncbi:hypothetical protein [Mycolicibacterium holsaticum]|nr:hypothetical protein [Mycolicibacterium holsaticum]
MTETHLCAELDQTGVNGWDRRVGADAQNFRGAPQQSRVAERLGGCKQQQLTRLRRKGLDFAAVTVFHRLRNPRRAGKCEPARQVLPVDAAGQLQQCQRVTARFCDRPRTHPLVDRSGQHGVQ